MQLNKFKAVAKPRNPWQAIDLGFVMARAWYVQLFILWGLPAALLYLVLMTLFYDKPFVIALIVWWLKPVWERPILHVISRQLFDNHIPNGDVFRSYFTIVKFDLLPWLMWRRLSPCRAFDMPVTQLEQIKGRGRTSRLQLLHLRFGGPASWLLIACAHGEMFLILGLAAGFALFIPQGVDPDWSLWLMDNSDLVNHLYNAMWLFCAALVAPFYVCSGFSLYLQRRIDLEAWDIEIQFRRLLQRKNTRKSVLTSTSLMLACVSVSVVYSFFAPAQALAGSDSPMGENTDTHSTQEEVLSPAKKASRQTINDVFEDQDFRNIEQRSGYRLKTKDAEEGNAIPDWMISMAEWLEGLDGAGGFFQALGDGIRWVAKSLEVILWGGVISLLVFLIYYYRSFVFRLLRYRQDVNDDFTAPPKTLFGLDVTQASLPDDVVDAAQKYWVQGRQRLALALLLRSSIVKFIDMRCEFVSGNTEKECALIVQKTLDVGYSYYFSRLVEQWQAVAYAHGQCEAESFEALCLDWRKAFTHE